MFNKKDKETASHSEPEKNTDIAVNITGDAVCTTVVARQEKRLDLDIFNNPNAGAEVGIGMK